MRDLVIWAGPVYDRQVSGATVPDAVEKFFQCRGDVSPRCSEVSWSVRDGDGRRLPSIAKAAKTTLEDTRDVFLGAFSAGGGLLRDIVGNETDRKLVRAMLLADATYSGAWTDQKNRIPLVNDFWLQWGEYLVNGDGRQLWIATASPSPNFNMASGVETLAEIRRQIELRIGKKFKKLDGFFGIDPLPDVAYQLGSVIFAEYPMEPLGHGGHTKIAPQVWQKIMWPWLERVRAGKDPWPSSELPHVPGPGVITEEPLEEDFLPWLVLGSASLFGYFLVRWLTKRRK